MDRNALFATAVVALAAILSGCGGGAATTPASSSAADSHVTVAQTTVPNASTSAPAAAPLPAASPRVASLSWVPPRTYEDGSTLSDLVGYRIYGGSNPEQMKLVAELKNPGLTAYVVEQLDRGTHYFAMTALSGNGAESSPSAVRTIRIP